MAKLAIMYVFVNVMVALYIWAIHSRAEDALKAQTNRLQQMVRALGSGAGRES